MSKKDRRRFIMSLSKQPLYPVRREKLFLQTLRLGTYHREIAAVLNAKQYIPDYVQSVLDDVKMTAPHSFEFGRRQKEMLELLVKHDADYKAVVARIESGRYRAE
ncbi:MAG: hypothetical protein LBT01_06365 [Spirochaetaceae bacterium]|nr:hypothetical protein [Spirochaetaceae bacterium]